MDRRSKSIAEAIVAEIRQRGYRITIPWLRRKTLKSLVSPVDWIREGLRFRGRNALKYGLMLAFLDCTGSSEAGCVTGLYGTLEGCFLSESVWREILLKLNWPSLTRMVLDGTPISGPVNIFFGGLWEDTKGLGKVMPFVLALFRPLILPAIAAYNEFTSRPPKKVRMSKEPKVSQSGGNCASAPGLDRVQTTPNAEDSQSQETPGSDRFG
ncbi:hypothetical protein B0H15DRAFT_657568 [Mycena belliarum]|uniref:Uncharacterized protein n=1 Tax=Mycena belliarum TaxID=1033014 RepID=A0AAD6XHH9_9AGAR|nr:hypothetical protein B0H15DRAFT_657568 [Mycena belliae]